MDLADWREFFLSGFEFPDVLLEFMCDVFCPGVSVGIAFHQAENAPH